MKGMIHIYCGDGKGKTTCAMGLGMRSAGRGNKVLLAQFLKNGNSGERASIALLPTFTAMDVPEQVKFTFAMTEEEKKQAAAYYTNMFQEAAAAAREGKCDLLLLDEMCSAVTTGMVPLELVTDFLDHKPEELEVVMTGRNPPQELVDRADYITEMKKIRHPFDKGMNARVGVEF